MHQVAIKTIGLDVIADLMEQSNIEQSVDTGSSMIVNVLHPSLGALTLITNCMDTTGVVLVQPQFESLLPN